MRYTPVAIFVFTCAAGAAKNAPTPSITLPWGTWQADKFEEDGKFYTFSNIRFGKAPVGHLRFNASEYPEGLDNPGVVQDNSYGPACHQIDTERCDCPPVTCPKSDQPQSPFLTMALGPHSEDCLFLDMYIPASAFESNTSLPVIVWFHGGGFLFGAKDSHESGLPLYKGNGILQAAHAMDSDVIFVVGNYRLGMLGWLAGPTMEEQAIPNAGLYDQRLLLQWVQDYIHLVGGDRTRVSAWGESAGASSIMHHVIAYGGQQDPLFSKAVVLSPGFEWQWDRSSNGNMEQLYQNLTELTHCSQGGIRCLRGLDGGFLARKSQELYNRNKCSGHYSIGPAVDGNLIRDLPSVAYAKSAHWKGLTSLVISHVADEASNFVPKYIDKQDDLDEWLHDFLPSDSLSHVRKEVAHRYGQGNYGKARHRASAILQDAFFTCNTRHFYDAYNSSARYMIQYDFLQNFGLAIHASDLLPLFWNKQVDLTKFIKKQLSYLPGFVSSWVASYFSDFATQYQKYLISHAAHGTPNKAKDKNAPSWKRAKNQDALGNVMQTSFSFFENYFDSRSVDHINTASTCEFWTEVAMNVSSATPESKSHYLLQQHEQVNLEL